MNKFPKSEYHIPYSKEEIVPDSEVVYSSIGIENNVTVPPEIEHLYNEALLLFQKLVEPKGFFVPIEIEEFNIILEGEGENDGAIPLELITERGVFIALFIATLGAKVSSKIEELIKEKDYPLGHMLDTIASRSAENATEIGEKYFQKEIKNNFSLNNQKVLLYSPGYCGWNVTAQKKIFKFLQPEKIGIALNESSLMTPIKSVSGVLISGERDIHKFRMIYPFCKTCQTYSCRERIKN